MSNLIHCDGPGCDKTEPRYKDRQLCESPWLRVDQGEGDRKLDFHDRVCLSSWAIAQLPTLKRRPDTATCMCDGSQLDPHTIAQHRPRPMVVDGR